MRLLVLSHTFPPSPRANAKRPGYLVDAFLKGGWEVDVYTTFLGLDPATRETMVHPRMRIFRSELRGEKWVARFDKQPALRRLLSVLLAGTTWPDVCYKWVLNTMAETNKTGPYDRVLGFLLPASMLLSGWCKGRVGRNWVFDYQESVTPHMRLYGRRSPIQNTMRPVLAKLERGTLHKAGRVVFTAETNRRAYVEAELVPQDRTSHVPYFFDAGLFATPAPPVPPDFEIVYFGMFDWTGARSPETFLRAMAKFLSLHPEARPKTRFVFYGTWLSEHDKYVNELGLRDVVSIRPPVPYHGYIDKVRSSPILLLVVAPEHNLFMPSKIVDYFGAKRPILAFVPKGSEMEDVLQRAGMGEFCCTEADVDAGVSTLEQLWKRYREGSLAVDSAKIGFWSSDTQLPRFIQLVEQAGAHTDKSGSANS